MRDLVSQAALFHTLLRVGSDQTASARRPRLHDVAVRAGVSLGTVSNVLNYPQKVAPDTRSRVFDAIDELGFAPNGIASALARGGTRIIGLVVIDLSNSLFVAIARAVQQRASQLGLYLQLSTSENDYSLQDQQMRVLNQSQARGLLVAPLEDPIAAITRSRGQGCPVVVLNYDTGDPDVCQVLVNNELAGRIAVEHLVAIGRRRIAFVGGHEEWQPVARRLHGARAAAAEHADTILSEVHTASVEMHEGTRVGRAIAAMPRTERPDAVLAVTDLLAAAIIDELLVAGIRIPDDVAVMGCDQNSSAWGGAVPLSTVTMQGEEMGTEGIRLLADEIDHPEEHRHEHVVLEPRLVTRESTVGRATAVDRLAR